MRMQMNPTEVNRYVVCALYKFTTLENYQEIKEPLLKQMTNANVRGTLLLAIEGINGTIAGSREGIDLIIDWLAQYEGLETIEIKESYSSIPPFKRSKVKLKKEIVTMGVEDIDPRNIEGTHVLPLKWNQLIDDHEVMVVDTRNEYEVEVGTFQNAVNPHTTNFREFPAFVDQNLNPNQQKKIAMFCTSGIRCEKSTVYLKQQGFEEVYHLKGGILKYLEEIPKLDSRWQGECFVFDDRVTVDHSLKEGSYDQCHACRRPITEQGKKHQMYKKGVSCQHCFNLYSDKDRVRFQEREKQVLLAEQRGTTHLGPESMMIRKKNIPSLKKNELD